MIVCDCGNIIDDEKFRYCHYCGVSIEHVKQNQEQRMQAWRQAQDVHVRVLERVQQLLHALQAIESQAKPLVFSVQASSIPLPSNVTQSLTALNEKRFVIMHELSKLLDPQVLTVMDKTTKEFMRVANMFHALQTSAIFHDLHQLAQSTQTLPPSAQTQESSRLQEHVTQSPITPSTRPPTPLSPSPSGSKLSSAQNAQRIQRFPLRSLVTDKIIGYWYAYLGIIIIALGILALLNYLRPIVQSLAFSELSMTQALTFLLPSYMLSILLLTYSLLPKKTSSTLQHTLKIISASISAILFLITLYAHVGILKPVWGYNNPFFFGLGVLLFALSMNTSSYLNKSSVLSVTTVLLEIMITWTVITWFALPSSSLLEIRIAISMWSFLIVLLTSLLVLTRKQWLSLFTLNILFPILLLQYSQTFYGPLALLFLFPLTTFSLSIKNAFSTPKSFTHFHVFSITLYTNTIFLIISIPQLSHATPLTRLIYSFLLSGFFLVYWIYALLETDLSILIQYPVSFNYSSEQVKLKTIKLKLNLVLILTILFPLSYAGIARTLGDHISPLIITSVFLIIILADYKKHLLNVLQSIYWFFILSAEILFLISITPQTPSTWAILTLTTFHFTLISQRGRHIMSRSQSPFTPYNALLLLTILNTALTSIIPTIHSAIGVSLFLISLVLINYYDWKRPIPHSSMSQIRNFLQQYGIISITVINGLLMTTLVFILHRPFLSPSQVTLLTATLFLYATYPLFFLIKKPIVIPTTFLVFTMYAPLQLFLALPYYDQTPLTYTTIANTILMVSALLTIPLFSFFLRKHDALSSSLFYFTMLAYMGILVALSINPIYYWWLKNHDLISQRTSFPFGTIFFYLLLLASIIVSTRFSHIHDMLHRPQDPLIIPSQQHGGSNHE